MHRTIALAAVHVDTSDDEGLVAAAQRDPRAFGVFYDRYATQVYRYLRSRTPSDDEAADLTQQVFLRALDALPRYRQRGVPVVAWLFRIARNLATDAHRRRRVTVTWDLVPESLQPVEERGTEESVLRREELYELQRLLLQLAPEKREVVVLRFMAGLTAREVAVVIGKSEAAVHKQLARTLRELKEHSHVD
jgi:RNA polymerase sigma-70 factor, ECF subfamily